jgi:hypothetical protein
MVDGNEILYNKFRNLFTLVLSLAQFHRYKVIKTDFKKQKHHFRSFKTSGDPNSTAVIPK